MSAADQAAILSYPIAYRGGDGGGGITLNNHRTTAGAQTPNVADAYVVEKFDFSPIEFRDQRDGLHLLMGGDLGAVSDEFRFLSITGYINGSTGAKLEDRVAKLEAMFNPVNCVAASPSTRGVLPLDFYCPTEVPPVGVSPVHELFSGRPSGIPAVYERRGVGLSMVFALQLICPDTGRYLYTAESKQVTPGAPSIAIPNWTAAMGAPTKGIITIVMTAAGSNPLVLRYVDTLTGVTTNLNLNLSGIGGGAHTITVDVGSGIIKLDGTANAALRTSAVDTCIWQINAGGGTFSIPSGTSNVTSATLAYRQARV